jgi:hypothetical protein
MRYYVLCYSDFEGIAPHIIAEVVRDGADDDRRTSIASALAGERAVVATRSELLADPVAREALEAWEARNDAEYDRETRAILGDEQLPTRIHAAGPEEAVPRLRVGSLPRLERHRHVLYEARGLRAVTRSLVERSREQRAAILAARAGARQGKESLREVVVNGP